MEREAEAGAGAGAGPPPAPALAAGAEVLARVKRRQGGGSPSPPPSRLLPDLLLGRPPPGAPPAAPTTGAAAAGEGAGGGEGAAGGFNPSAFASQVLKGSGSAAPAEVRRLTGELAALDAELRAEIAARHGELLAQVQGTREAEVRQRESAEAAPPRLAALPPLPQSAVPRHPPPTTGVEFPVKPSEPEGSLVED